MRVKIGRTILEIVKCDITEVDVEAISNAANDYLWMGSGVAGAIKKKGGDEIEKEAIAKGPVEIGEVVVTGAGKLKAKYVLHAVVMGQNHKTDTDYVKKATYRVLEKSDELGLSSVALPAFGTGVGRLPMADCAKTMFDAIFDYLLKVNTGLQKIIIALFDDGAYNIFRKVLEERFKRRG